MEEPSPHSIAGAAESSRQPWRSGGGWTQLLAQSDGGEPVEWRISLAEIERDGPFSDFSGYDRTIVAEDAGFTLEFADGECVDVLPRAPFSFDGGRPVVCRLHAARARALNVMTLRDAFAHDLRMDDGEFAISLADVLADGPPVVQTPADFAQWERDRRRFASWEALVKLRYAQNVHDTRAQSASARLAVLAPQAQRRDMEMKRRLLASPCRPALEAAIGRHAFARWTQDVLGFHPEIEPHLVREAQLYDDYTRLTAAAAFEFEGRTHTAASLGAFARHADRGKRRSASLLLWKFYEDRAAQFDASFDELVRCRAAMARTLEYESYSQLAHVRLGRTDYTRDDVRRLRQSIEQYVVPLCARLTAKQARDLDLDAVLPWDELLFDQGETLRPQVEGPQVVHALVRALESVHPDLGAFAAAMRERNLFDFAVRPGKRGGAFCSYFPSTRMPFVFANAAGTSGDVGSLVHETGHAFQDYASRDHAVLEYVVPPAETGEISSLGLEYLLWEQYEMFFGSHARRYRAQHLKSMVLALPYVAAIDHFQELVYDAPGASPPERRRMWLDVHERYLPHRNIEGVPHLSSGGGWHRQHHVYGFPFYYIDYALALFAAFDLLRRSRADYPSARNAYLAVARHGGSLPFRELLKACEVADPFDPGTVEQITAFLERSPEFLTPAQ